MLLIIQETKVLLLNVVILNFFFLNKFGNRKKVYVSEILVLTSLYLE